MNCIFIHCRTVVEQPRGLAPPLGLIVYDVPLFTWLVCERVGYYDSSLFRRREGWPYLTDCAAWMFESRPMFRRGGRFRRRDDSFVIEFDLAGGSYATPRLALDEVLHAGAYRSITTVLPKTSSKGRATSRVGSPIGPYRGPLRAWLAAEKAKVDNLEYAAETGSLGFPALEEE